MKLPTLLSRDRHRPYDAKGGALQMWASKDDEILFEGPAGTGKSRAVLEKMHFCAQKYPGYRGLIVRKTRESCTESVLVTFESKVVTPGHPCLKGPSRRLRAAYSYPNGSEIIIGGMDKPDKVMSTEYDQIGMFESTECTEEDQENLTTRLRNGAMPYQQIINDCNPGAPSHWLNKRANQAKMKRILSRHEDNPTLFQNGEWSDFGKKYMMKLERLSGARYLRLRKGIWAAQEGMVYEMYDRSVHVISRFTVPRQWRRILVIDFGFKNPFVAQWWAIDNDDNMYLYREIYRSHRLVSDHAIQIKAYSKDEVLESIISDHDAEDRATLHECGIMTMPAHKAITPGIEAIQRRMRFSKELKLKPSIFFMEDSLVERDERLAEAGLPTHTVDEFESYVYPKNDQGKPIKEEPVKKDDHGMDATRYAVAYVDDVAAVSVHVQADSAVTVR